MEMWDQKGSLKKRCGKWVGQWRENGVRRNQVLGPIATMRKSDARAALDKVLVAVNERPSPVASASCTLRDFVEDVFFPFHLRKWKTSTASSTMYRIRHHLVGELGSRVLREINRQDMQGLLDGKAQTGLSYSTVDHLRWDLNQILEMALAEGVVVKNAATLLFTPREATRGMRSPHIYPALMIALNAGLRDSEIRNLTWERVDLSNSLLTIARAKTDAGTGRTVPMNSALLQALTEHASWYERRFGQRLPDWFVFPFGKPRPSDPTRPVSSFKTAWNNLRRKTGVVGRWHDNRHTLITDLAEVGAPEETIRDIAGQVSKQMLRHYSHIRMEAKRSALESVLKTEGKEVGKETNRPGTGEIVSD